MFSFQYYVAQTEFVQDPRDNKIGEKQVGEQLSQAPPPRETGKSGYPHKFQNKNNQFPQLVTRSQREVRRDHEGQDGDAEDADQNSQASSTTSHFEYVVSADGKKFNYDLKKSKQTISSGPGHLRAITNQNKRFKGVIAHDGQDGEPSRGFFHWCERQEPEERE